MSNKSSGERTEKGSKKKKEKARKEGQVLKSTEVNTAFSVVIVFVFLYIIWNPFLESAQKMVGKHLSRAYIVEASEHVTPALVISLYGDALGEFLRIMVPVFLVAVLCGVLFQVLQTGFLFTPNVIMPKLSKINPMEGFKRIFSIRSVAELAKATLKVAFLCYFAYSEYVKLLDTFPQTVFVDLTQSFPEMMFAAFRIAIKMGGILVVIAALDYLYQWWKYEKDLMMTKQEVKDEHKQMEGDPQIKGRIRQKQRQMSRMRMMQRVPDADVVITNPTHYAVAIRYKENEDGAPLVLAKGADYLARKIKELAKKNKIEIVENKPVAQALYHYCEIGQEIPEDMYKAVAEILVYVYKIKNKMR